MGFLIASLIAATIGLVGTGIGAAVNQSENKKNREFNSAEAQKQRDFEQEMSNSAYQRQVADMKEAGINPILAAGGSGATTPTASSASATAHSSTGNIISEGISSAANLALSFNLDKNKKNDMYPSQVVDMVSQLSGIFKK